MTLPNLHPPLSKQQLVENINYVLSCPDRGELLEITWLKDILLTTLDHLDKQIILSTASNYIQPITPSEVMYIYISSLPTSFNDHKTIVSQIFQCFINNISTTIFHNEFWSVPEYPSKIMNDYFYAVQYYYENTNTFEANGAFNALDYTGLLNITNSATRQYVIKFIEVFRLSIGQFEIMKNWRASTVERQQFILTDIINEMIAIQNYINLSK